ncbi:lysophospholipid acyltransferase family protein [Tumebacillus flagellatus]|uniref:Phospholipid/glycerol acyltransferase domain-containing protein n=1 Tax=Tumebacillus flagellatus TaxID=1157490 RepID=A0A074LYT3_9BACL|nr:lysophospholipid acyltransferase family protein [Tumebacillus flagellatus]KEO85188.1 hypothetical protein EL26_01115 [Tumebacillus flagellatus]
MIYAQKKALFERVFKVYNTWLMRRFFRGVLVQHAEALHTEGRPLLLYGNHSNWWDGLVVFHLNSTLWKKDAYLMMEEKGLRQYPFFRKLGAYSIHAESTSEIRKSLRYTAERLTHPGSLVCLYPQGKILHQDARPLAFRPGISWLLRHAPHALVCPMATYYGFREDQRPEVFVTFGTPRSVQDVLAAAQDPTGVLEEELTQLLDSLQRQVVANVGGEPLPGFRNLLQGASSTGDRYRAVFRRGLE